jgi:predicted lactoylglutathione lyase
MRFDPWKVAEMINKIFVNLPVKDLDKSMAFFKAIGFSFNPQFTDKTAACMVISEDIYAMLLTHDKVKEFSKKQIADAHKTTEVLPPWPSRARLR